MTPVPDNRLMIGMRSVTFHLTSAVVTFGFVLLFPLIVLPRDRVWAILRTYIQTQLWLLRVVCRQNVRVLGKENLPDGPCILASRHEALWETLFLPLLFENPTVILKDDILRYPFVGAVARKLEFVGVDRTGAPERAKASFDQAREQIRQGRRVLIFPSGTRRPEHRLRVQKGVAVLYRALKLPCVPIVLDSGAAWPYRSWLRKPGTITVRILPVISGGLRTNEFLTRLETDLSQPV